MSPDLSTSVSCPSLEPYTYLGRPQTLRHEDGDGLDKNGPHRFIGLTTWSPIGRNFGKDLGVWPYWRCVTDCGLL